MVKEERKERGYDPGEEYSYKVNKDLIERKRKQLDAQRGE
jgi:hypothetical protein